MSQGFTLARVEVVAKRDGLSFVEAARRCARKGARVKRAKKAEGERLTRFKSTWWAKRDFE